MAFRIFLDQTIIQIIDETGHDEPRQFNPSRIRYSIQDGLFVFFDSISLTKFLGPDYTGFLDRNGNPFDNETAFIQYLNGFINALGGAVASNPLPSYDMDSGGRPAFNTVFGDRYTGIRKADVSAMFQYGFPAGSSDPEIENGGFITIDESMLVVGTGADPAGRAKIANKKALRYIPGYEAFIYFTAVFSPGRSGSSQRAGVFDNQNGFFIGYEDADFCVTRRRNGIDTKHVIDVPNVFGFDYLYDPTKGNVYKISFGYLGFAPITFEVQRPDKRWIVIYEIQYPNSSDQTHITNTNLPPAFEIFNTGNTIPLTAKSGSFAGGIIDGGGLDPASRKFSFSQNAIDIVAEFMMVVTFRNKTAFNSIKNYIQSTLMLLNPATDLSKNSIWEFRKGMTVTNTPTWTDVNIDSTTEYSNDAVVTPDTGSLLFSFSMGKTIALFEDVTKYELDLFPGESVSLIIKTPLGTNGSFDFSMRWKELF